MEEKCFYCGNEYPVPVEYYHGEDECCGSGTCPNCQEQ